MAGEPSTTSRLRKHSETAEVGVVRRARSKAPNGSVRTRPRATATPNDQCGDRHARRAPSPPRPPRRRHRPAPRAPVRGRLGPAHPGAARPDSPGRRRPPRPRVGIGLGAGLADTSPQQWERVLSLNLSAPFLAAKYGLPAIADGGSIVFVGSVAALRAATNSPAYDSSKAGLFGLTRHVAKEGAPHGIRANLVVPGLIDMPMGREASARRASRSASFTRIPLGRQGTAREVAEAVTFLLSGCASYITGQSLVVDGGLSAVG
ncbi:SDR family NAD(P)-dependent oxidoreductase [Streptomyces sp. NPDC004059]